MGNASESRSKRGTQKSFNQNRMLVASGLAAAAVAGLSPFGVRPAQAVIRNWTGVTTGVWNTTTNWSTTTGTLTTADALTILGPANAAGALNIDINAASAGGSVNITDTAAVTLTNVNSGSDQTLTFGSAGANGLTTGTGAVTIGSATANQAVNIALGANQTWNIGAGGLTVNNAISGAFSLTKATGTGTLTLNSATNSYTGGTTVTAGTLSLAGSLTGSGNNILVNGGTFTEASTGVIGTSVGTYTQTSGTSTLQGANTYTGVTTIGTAGSTASGGTLTVSGASGAINGSTAISIVGSVSKLLLDNSAGVLERINNSANVNLGLGGEFSISAGSTAVETETIANLGFGAGTSTVTLAATGTGSMTKIAAAQLARTGNGTGFIRASSFGTQSTIVGKISLTTTPTGADFVGAGGQPAGTGTTKNLGIVPWLFSTTAAGNTAGTDFVTYDSTQGSLRALVSGEYDATTITLATSGNNVKDSTTSETSIASNTVNSLLLVPTATQTVTGAGGGSNVLTISSGALASALASGALGTAAFNSTISGFDAVAFGNGEAVVTIAQTGGTITIGSPVSVTSSGGLTKTGAGTLVLNGVNTYSGATTVNQGSLTIGGAGQLNSGTYAGNINLLSSTGTSVLTYNSTAAQTLSGGISGSGNFVKLNTNTLTLSGGGNFGTGAITTYGGTNSVTLLGGTTKISSGTYTSAGEFVVGGVLSAGGAGVNTNLTIDGGTLNISNYLSLGRGNGMGAVSSDIILNNGAAITASNFSSGFNNTSANTPKGIFTLNNTSTFADSGVFNLGESAGSDMTMTLTGSSVLTSTATGNNTQFVGNGGTGTLNINGTSTANFAADVNLGSSSTGNGRVNLNGGTLNFSTGALKWFRVGVAGVGRVDINSGTWKMENNSQIKFSDGAGVGDVVNQNGGAVTFYSNAGTTVGGTGALDMQLAGSTSSNNTYNLNGGTLTVPQIISTATTGTRTFNFNGGTLGATGATTTFFNSGVVTTANVRDGGAIIDTNGNSVTIGQALTHSNIATINPNTGLVDSSTDGGLTKTNTGTLTLTGANTYTGTTTLNQGTLTVGIGGTIGATTAALSVNNTNSTAAGTASILNLLVAGDTTTGSLSGTIATPISGTNTATINTQTSRNFTVNQTTAGTYAGVIAGAGTFTLGSLSTNTLTLAGVNGYTGTTTINAGKLNVTGTINSSSGVTINGSTGELAYNNSSTALSQPITFTSGTLSGTGTITAAVNATNNNDTVAPGTTSAAYAYGKLTVKNFSLNSGGSPGGKLAIDVSKAAAGGSVGAGGGTYDQLAVASTASAPDVTNGVLVLSIGNNVEVGDVYYIVDNGTGLGITGTFGTATINGSSPITPGTVTVAGQTFQSFQSGIFTFAVSYTAVTSSSFYGGGTGNDIALDVVAAPEPTSLALLGLGSMALLSRRRRKA